MKVILSLFGILISIATFAQSESNLFKSFKNNFNSNTKLNEQFEISNYITPQYLISDFNGDKVEDIAVLIINRQSNKRGFIIYHSNSNIFFVIGAGNIFNDKDKWDDLNWIDVWKINTKRSNMPGIQGGPNLNLDFDSIEITKDEIGGGLIYWNGKKYNYFHQTC